MKVAGVHDRRDGAPTPGDENETRAAALAALLFDLRAAHEADLRALTWIQRNLEDVRSGRANGDTDLLLGEMARLFGQCQAAGGQVTECREAAASLLQDIIAGRKPAAAPVAIFAA
jgi:hypothetical protein